MVTITIVTPRQINDNTVNKITSNQILDASKLEISDCSFPAWNTMTIEKTNR